MVAPHLELRDSIRKQDFDILDFFQTYGFSVFPPDSTSYTDTYKNPLKNLFFETLGGTLLFNTNFCYVCSFGDGSNKFQHIDFFTPDLRRLRNSQGLRNDEVASLCELLSQELRENAMIRRVDLVKSDSPIIVDDLVTYEAVYRKVYGNCNSYEISSGSSSQITLEEGYFK